MTYVLFSKWIPMGSLMTQLHSQNKKLNNRGFLVFLHYSFQMFFGVIATNVLAKKYLEQVAFWLLRWRNAESSQC